MFSDFLFTKEEKLIIPNSLDQKILLDVNLYLQHPGRNGLTQNINRYWKIEKLGSKLKELIANCYDCQANKTFRSNAGYLRGHVTSDTPYDFISTDIYGPLKTEHFPEDENNIINQRQFYVKRSDLDPFPSLFII